MIRVLALTQFAFLSLGVVVLKIMLQANPGLDGSSYLLRLDRIALWLFVVPLVWVAFASACVNLDRGILRPKLAQALGVLLAIACFLFLVASTFLTSR
ncbi:MAG TPA: hypothetical protein VIM61_11960 [Chthoniobacterales bacterium]|jgi:hypothetical protein